MELPQKLQLRIKIFQYALLIKNKYDIWNVHSDQISFLPALRAIVSLAPSPHIATQYPNAIKCSTSWAFCSGFMRAYTQPLRRTFSSSFGNDRRIMANVFPVMAKLYASWSRLRLADTVWAVKSVMKAGGCFSTLRWCWCFKSTESSASRHSTLDCLLSSPPKSSSSASTMITRFLAGTMPQLRAIHNAVSRLSPVTIKVRIDASTVSSAMIELVSGLMMFWVMRRP